MIKVLIADDEKWVRVTIKNALPLEKLDLMLIGEASSGLEALKLSLELKPDILITDIRMPGLNGLELIEETKNQLPYLKTIILSGYDDFEYAKKGIQLGAFDYLLKPVNRENLMNVLSKVKDVLAEENKKIEMEKALKIQYEALMLHARDKFLNEIIKDDSYHTDEIKRQFASFNIALKLYKFGVITTSIDEYVTKIKTLYRYDKQIVLSKYKKIMDKIVKRYFKGIAFFNINVENEVILIYNQDSKIDLQYIQNVLLISNKITKRRLNIVFSAGVSSQDFRVNKLSQLYSEASTALKYKMIYGKGSINFYTHIYNIKTKDFHISKDILNEIVFNMELLNEYNVSTIINNTFELVSNCRETSPEIIKSAFWELIIDTYSNLCCKTLTINSLYEFKCSSVYEEFKRLDTLEDINEYIKKLFSSILNNHLKKGQTQSQNTIDIAKKYIDTHYFMDITLVLISGYVFLNPTYFSELFKKETGQNFSEYVTNLRLEKAKELLKDTGLKIYEVCESVGYSNTKYFCKLFKRFTGKTPSEYKIGQLA